MHYSHDAKPSNRTGPQRRMAGSSASLRWCWCWRRWQARSHHRIVVAASKVYWPKIKQGVEKWKGLTAPIAFCSFLKPAASHLLISASSPRIRPSAERRRRGFFFSSLTGAVADFAEAVVTSVSYPAREGGKRAEARASVRLTVGREATTRRALVILKEPLKNKGEIKKKNSWTYSSMLG
ncbi:hypothetical protein Cgig2_031587 [Carnegiea gigantea]|uniref:Uncharacterized protein n=1 Tax=Carnegiea gigantea TaxID=171969 RepID=A0A9Q1GR76_9CARY|nr:hypothetical protein Cgig2_031587 [Carnegiea gigantea]